MATITLTANTNYSSLTVANDDTIDCAGFVLTLDVQPTETGVQVTSPGTNGRVVFSGAWVLPTWDFFVGSGRMIETLPAGSIVRGCFGGAVNNIHCVNTNNGTIINAAGSLTGSNSRSVNNNNGTIVNVTAGLLARGVQTNNGTITNVTGGTGGVAIGVLTNNGTITHVTGGSSALASGVDTNNGVILRISDDTAPAVNTWTGSICFVEGPFINGVIPSSIKTIYSLGPLSESATIASDATVIELSEGGASFPPIGPGGLVY